MKAETHPDSPPGQPGLRQEITLSMAQANLYMLFITLPLMGLLSWFFAIFWGWTPILVELPWILDWRTLLPLLIVGVVIHELLHGLSWAYFGRQPLNRLKFGFQFKTITPYAHIGEPISTRAYRLGTIMPALVLGLLPYLAGLLNGSGRWVLVGLLFIFAAGGDLLILWLLRGVPSDASIEDHPTLAGCIVHLEP